MPAQGYGTSKPDWFIKPQSTPLPDEGELCVLFPVAQVAWWDSARNRWNKIGTHEPIDDAWNVREFIRLGRDKV